MINKKPLALVIFLITTSSSKPDVMLHILSHQGFSARLGIQGESRSLRGLLESTRKNRGRQAFFRDI